MVVLEVVVVDSVFGTSETGELLVEMSLADDPVLFSPPPQEAIDVSTNTRTRIRDSVLRIFFIEFTPFISALN